MKSQFRAQPCITPIAVSVPIELSAFDKKFGLPALRQSVEESQKIIELLMDEGRKAYEELNRRVEVLENGGKPPATPAPQEEQADLGSCVILTGKPAAWLNRAGLDWGDVVKVTESGTQLEPLLKILARHVEKDEHKRYLKPVAEMVLNAIRVADTVQSSATAAKATPAPRGTRTRRP